MNDWVALAGIGSGVLIALVSIVGNLRILKRKIDSETQKELREKRITAYKSIYDCCGQLERDEINLDDFKKHIHHDLLWIDQDIHRAISIVELLSFTENIKESFRNQSIKQLCFMLQDKVNELYGETSIIKGIRSILKRIRFRSFKKRLIQGRPESKSGTRKDKKKK